MRIVDYIQQGGPIMYILLLLNIIGFAIMISKILLLKKESQRSNDVVESLHGQIGSEVHTKDANSIIEISKRELNSYIEGIEKGLNTVKIIATVSPLLGLLGTVVGVLIAFRVMSESGLNNPASFAQGISMALITTVGGLVVAIPHYIGHNYLIGMVDHLEANIEKKLLTKLL